MNIHQSHRRHCEEAARPTRQSRIWIASLTLAMTLITMSLTACGFAPVYGTLCKDDARAPEKHLEQIYIENIPDQEGQYLRNALIDRFYRSGRPADPQYRLFVSNIGENLTNLDITKTSDATRGQLRLSATMTLHDVRHNEEVLRRHVQAITSYNILASEFSTRVSEQNARQNALDDLARQIQLQLGLYFNR